MGVLAISRRKKAQLEVCLFLYILNFASWKSIQKQRESRPNVAHLGLKIQRVKTDSRNVPIPIHIVRHLCIWQNRR